MSVSTWIPDFIRGQQIGRRGFISMAASMGAVIALPRLVLATADTERRFIFVIQRGAADGLSTVIPYADPNYAMLRKELTISPAESLKLNGTFALHRSLEQIGRMYGQKQALFVHATASPYRDRSHFDGQNVLESGGQQPYELRDGWLNRLLQIMPHARATAVAVGPAVPLTLQGAVQIDAYAPSALPTARGDLIDQAGLLFESDAQLHALWAGAIEAKAALEVSRARQDPAGLGRLAGTFLSKANGARIAMLEMGGWDTHEQQGARLARQLTSLDQLVSALRDELGVLWAHTTVLIATEFGRTASINGTGGTDHGTGAVAMIVGGAVNGGRVLADWPGLSQNQLYKNRDLLPTTPLNGVIAGAAAEALGLDPEQVARAIFPKSKTKALIGLVA